MKIKNFIFVFEKVLKTMNVFLSVDQLTDGVWKQDHLAHPENEYRFEHAGLQCTVKKMPITFTWNGYVTLPPTHPSYNKHCDEIDNIQVHGGLTFSENGTIGFDTSHCLTDIIPSDFVLLAQMPDLKDLMHEKTFSGQKQFWTFDMVKSETQRLAQQLADQVSTLDKIKNFMF